jgi:hypothetical protein
MRDPIRGKVARVLNSRELALNLGSEHGVKIGMFFDILDPKGDNITDPDTGEIIGSIERAKVRVKVVSVQARLSVASTYKKERVNIGGSGSLVGFGSSGLSKLFLPPEYITQYETLKTQERTWEDLSEGESYVKSGDPVVEVQESIE